MEMRVAGGMAPVWQLRAHQVRKADVTRNKEQHRVNARTRKGDVTMTKFDQSWVRHEEKKRHWMSKNALYRDSDEHASCGVVLVVSIDGKKSRKPIL